MPVGGIDVGHTHGNEGHDDHQLDGDDDVVEGGGFFDADHQQHGDDGHNAHGRHIEDRAGVDPALGEEPPDIPAGIGRRDMVIGR